MIGELRCFLTPARWKINEMKSCCQLPAPLPHGRPGATCSLHISLAKEPCIQVQRRDYRIGAFVRGKQPVVGAAEVMLRCKKKGNLATAA